ncbi:MAG: hypothetical protein L0287_05965 [Anaerolineae bacterium]|nr:hypothetical protein [Anaerolineae bacterium]MCI0609300.1 hypothetical protein [Anaerolineae bacterium]
MKLKNFYFIILFITASLACNLSNGSPTISPSAIAANTSTNIPPSETFTPSPVSTFTFTPLPTDTAAPTETPTSVPIPTVESLKAKVTAERLSCRYGPGPEYLYLFALRQTANVKLIGRVDADNWNWVLVENQVPCWVSGEFLEIQGDPLQLPIVYPGIAKLPVSPYYPPTAVISTKREGDKVTISWMDIPLIAGDEEDATMQHYIIEVWRCEAGQLIFDPLATNFLAISFIDEQGCNHPSHGQVWVQEKHGYAGPAEIPWPEP